MTTTQFTPQQEFINTQRMAPNAGVYQNHKPTAVSQPQSEDFGQLFRSSMSLENDVHDNDIYMDLPDGSAPLTASNTPKCASCEMLKKEIESLKRTHIPGSLLVSFFVIVTTIFYADLVMSRNLSSPTLRRKDYVTIKKNVCVVGLWHALWARACGFRKWRTTFLYRSV